MKNLELIAKIIEEETGRKAEVKNTYIDFGANWRDNNIIIDNQYQLLTPGELFKFNKEGLTLQEIQTKIDKINKRGW